MTKPSLRQLQSTFVSYIPLLLSKAFSLGFEVTLGDAYRDPRSFYGAKKSKHHRRLAIDLNLFKDGTYITTTSEHLPLGLYWESLGGIWGGRFNPPDGNHYEWPDR